MKHYHPADSRYRAPAQTRPAKSIRSYLADRATDAPITNTRDARKAAHAEKMAARATEEQAAHQVIRDAPIWMRVLHLGAIWLKFRAEHARNQTRGRGLTYMAFQVIAAISLYAAAVAFTTHFPVSF